MPHGITPNLPRMQCDNCPQKFQPKRRYLPTEKRFCSDNCRKEYHKRGGSFSKLKPVIIAEVRKAVKERNPLDAQWQAGIERQLSAIQNTLDRIAEVFATRP